MSQRPRVGSVEGPPRSPAPRPSPYFGPGSQQPALYAAPPTPPHDAPLDGFTLSAGYEVSSGSRSPTPGKPRTPTSSSPGTTYLASPPLEPSPFDEDRSRGLHKGGLQRAVVQAARLASPLCLFVAAAFALAALAMLWVTGVVDVPSLRAQRGVGSMNTEGMRQAYEARRARKQEEARAAAQQSRAAAQQSHQQQAAPAPPPPVDSRVRTVVLYSADGRINTGVWPSWGGEPPRKATLNWGTAGVKVVKSCPVTCHMLHDNAHLDSADAVVAEVLNWPKFGLSGPFPFPPRDRPNPRAALEPGVPAQLPLRGLFGYEPRTAYPDYSLRNPEVAKEFDFSVAQDGSSTLPITLVCPWGLPLARFTAPPPAKTAGNLVAYYSEHGCSRGYLKLLDEIFLAAGDRLHAYVHRANRHQPKEAVGEPFQLANKLNFIGTYRFLCVPPPLPLSLFSQPPPPPPLSLPPPRLRSFYPPPLCRSAR
jgi:hypothetical protein